MAKQDLVRLAANALLTLLLFTVQAFPQGAPTGAVTGVVKDSKGASVPDAQVEAYNEQTGRLARSLKTESDGSYTATLLPPGSYRVEVTVSGFKKYQGVGVPVRINEITRHDVALELGTVSETVTVEATPTIINTVNATTGQPVDTHTLTSLPLANPNFLFLLTLSPGANSEPIDVRSAGRGNVDIIVNGQRTTNNNVALEGINVNDFNLAHFDNLPIPSPSAIEEFKVATSLYDASQGSKGGGAVALVLKSGTKSLHGEAYWQHRNDVLNANEWFFSKNNKPRGRLLQNVFGGDASGPLWGLGGFWFANYQGVRARNGIDPNGSQVSPLVPNIPTQADGTTTASLLATAYGLTPSQIDPIAVNILNQHLSTFGGSFLVPRSGQPGCGTATSPTGTFSCTFSAVAPSKDNQFTISYDRPFRRNKDKISGRFFYDNGPVQKPLGTNAGFSNNLAFPESVTLDNRFVSLTWTHLFSSRQTNEGRVGFNRFFQPNIPTDLVNLSDIGATRPNISTVPGMYFINMTGLFRVGTGVNDERTTVSNTFYYADTWSMTTGKHTLRAGTEISRYQLNRSNKFAIRGSLGFASTSGAGNTFTPFQNFLQGRVTSNQSGVGDPQRYFRDTDYAFFFQDDFRVHPRFTLNMGLRWDLIGFAHDLFFRSGIYDSTLLQRQPPVNPFLFAQALNLGGFTGTPGVSDCTVRDCLDKNNVGPRFGFAWDVTGNQKWIVRSGIGVYFQRVSNQNLLQGSLAAPFFVQPINSFTNPASFQLQNPLSGLPSSGVIATAFIPQVARFAGLRCLTASCPTPLDPNSPNVGAIFVNGSNQACLNYGGTATNCVINLASFSSAQPDAHAPYTEQWNLSIQHELGHGWGLELAYVGAHNVGGLGVFAPFQARLASPTGPITVTDINGNTYTINTNTPSNEPLRMGVLGLDRARGARRLSNFGQSIYHSAQVTVSHRFQGGLFFQAAYTWSKLIDNVSGSLSTDELNNTRSGQGGAQILNDQSNPAQNRSVGDFDRPHRFIVSYVWDIPAPKSGIWGSQAFQGWSVSGIVTYQNGLPFSLIDSSSGGAFGNLGNNFGTGLLVCRAVQDPTLPTCTPGTPTTIQQVTARSGPLQNNLNHFINPNFVSPSTAVANGSSGATGYGNVPRNAFRGPFQQNWDFSVSKTFRFAERHQFQFRTDLFNLFNHPVFSFPASVDVGTPSTFGQINTTVLPARILQFGLRYAF